MPSSSLLPTDPSVLFTTAGMQQFKSYYTNPEIAPAKNVISIQKSFRTSSIDEVGDDSHLTFFEMLGNFSFGGYWKKEAIECAYEFITKILKLQIDYISVFGGDQDTLADSESETIWKSIDPSLEIKKLGREDNFWGPTGEEGPCGPSTEIFVKGIKYEIWNIVFNEFFCSKDKKFTPLEIQGIDTGMGLERLASAVQNKTNIFETDLFEPLIQLLPGEMEPKVQRIIVDHARATAFLISDGVVPSNKEQGYVLRRLLRRIIVHAHNFGLEVDAIREIFGTVVQNYGKHYPELDKEKIISEFDKENDKFQKTLKAGLRELGQLDSIDAKSGFRLYESYGLPYEIIKEVGGKKAEELTRSGFGQEMDKHREISRAGVEKKFGGHGIVEGDLTAATKEEMWQKTRLHTATHLLFAALKSVLGQEIKQAGSDITAKRLRFDFTFPRKLTPIEIQRVQDIANEAVLSDYKVTKEEMAYEDAIKSGATAFFKLKYPNRVKVYAIGPESVEGHPSETSGPPFSRELCGGPHVSHTAEIGKITITKEESVSGGRRIRATVE